MEVLEIPVDRLFPNPWNVNRMSAGMRVKLVRYLRREGLVEPLVVRPHPKEGGHYELIGGEHRWRIAREELGYKKVPCVVVDLDDRRAKILSVNLNTMSGETIPSLLSRLLSDLNQEMPVDDMAALLPYDKRDIADSMSLLQLPEGFGEELESEAEAQDREAPGVITLVLDPAQRAVFDSAMEVAMEKIGRAKDQKAQAVTLMAKEYLAGPRGTTEG